MVTVQFEDKQDKHFPAPFFFLCENKNPSTFAENIFQPRNTTLMTFTSCISASVLGPHRGKQRRDIFPMGNILVLTQNF